MNQKKAKALRRAVRKQLAVQPVPENVEPVALLQFATSLYKDVKRQFNKLPKDQR